MKYLIVKRNINSDSFNNLCKESIKKQYLNSILTDTKDASIWNKCEAIAFTASELNSQVLDCFEVDDQDHILLSLKYSEIIYKTITKELDEDLYIKMKQLGNMSKKLIELDNAISSLQNIESDLYDCFSDITDSEPNTYGFTDIDKDEFIAEFSLHNETVQEVFNDFFN